MVNLNTLGVKDTAAIEMAQDAVDAFAVGLEGRQPEPAAVALAVSIVEAALCHTAQPEVSVDVDGALSFDLRTSSGHLILAELSPDGGLDASVYDRQDKFLKRMPAPTADELIACFQG